MKKDKKILAEKATDYIINKSTIANGLKALYLQADASMLQLMRVTQRIDAVFRSVGATSKENPELGALKEYYTAVKRAVYFFEEFISKMVTDATWGSNEGENRARSYDNWQADANTLSRFILLLLDRTYHDGEQQYTIFKTLNEMESHGQFDEADFNYFDMKYPDEK